MQVTEAEAWEEFGEFVAETLPNGELRRYLCNYLSSWHGAGWHKMMDYAPVANWPREDMLKRIYGHIDLVDVMDGHTLEDERNDNSARVIFCLLMTIECEEEADAES